MSTKLDNLTLVYEGSVKRVWKTRDSNDVLWFEYTNDYSIFDWGKMPDTIQNKGRALVTMGAFFFEFLGNRQTWELLPSSDYLRRFDPGWLKCRWAHRAYINGLEQHGAPHHGKGLVACSGKAINTQQAATLKDPVYLQVLSGNVIRPEPCVLVEQSVFYYPPKPSETGRTLIPLEVVFRFGMPPGSSLAARLEKDPDYARVLGLKQIPQSGQWLEHPVIELFTKLEPKDRLLSVQEALLISGLSAAQFENMIEITYDVALALYDLFAHKNIELWDGKLEFLASGDGLMLADSIGPDELRLMYKGHSLSKEMLRQVYRGSPWEKSLKEAQRLAHQTGTLDWKTICLTQLNAKPEPLPSQIKTVVDNLYGVLSNHIMSESLFAQQPSLEEFIQAVSEVM
ncbi:MAG: hypothetical protein HY711_04270 [Candidatus Melainabacteria bacterium]|nr:hypothetical protein [Candidatus Melainabacteria bacterium]